MLFWKRDYYRFYSGRFSANTDDVIISRTYTLRNVSKSMASESSRNLKKMFVVSGNFWFATTWLPVFGTAYATTFSSLPLSHFLVFYDSPEASSYERRASFVHNRNNRFYQFFALPFPERSGKVFSNLPKIAAFLELRCHIWSWV